MSVQMAISNLLNYVFEGLKSNTFVKVFQYININTDIVLGQVHTSVTCTF